MKSLKIKQILAVCLLATATLASCSKDKKMTPEQPVVPGDPAPVAKTIEGSWVGKYGVDNMEPDQFFAFNIKPQGLLEVKDENNKVIGKGSWKLEEGVFSGSYKYTDDMFKYSVAAKYDSDLDELQGSWGMGDETSSGDFYMNKE